MSIFLHSESTIINHSDHLLSSKYYSSTLQILAISFYFVITYHIHYHSYNIRSQNIMIHTLRLPLFTPSLHMFPPSSFPCTTRHPTSHLVHPRSLACGFAMWTEPLLWLNDWWILIRPYPWIIYFHMTSCFYSPFIYYFILILFHHTLVFSLLIWLYTISPSFCMISLYIFSQLWIFYYSIALHTHIFAFHIFLFGLFTWLYQLLSISLFTSFHLQMFCSVWL